jgi:Archaeal fructose-1,6-bisphosphatase and related enzymes of inositol monophosphatase family
VIETPSFASPADDLRLALQLADVSDAISVARFRSSDLHVTTKPDRTHVTDADQAVERAIRSTLGAERPADGILGEEYGGDRGDTGAARRWIVDPIDGTHNYERGLPVWGTLIALAIRNEVVLGVASAPALGKRWWAARGSGAWAQENGGEPYRIRVSSIGDLADASMSFQSIQQWDEAGYLDRLVALTRRAWRDRAYGDLWSYALLAEGLIDVVGEFGVHPYDIAALIPIVEEAGGRFTSVTGGAPLWDPAPLATNGALHDTVLAALA